MFVWVPVPLLTRDTSTVLCVSVQLSSPSSVSSWMVKVSGSQFSVLSSTSSTRIGISESPV